ncbi:MAG: hypothetical protein ACXV3F_10000 [Frankiaceae bacterium]
MLPVEQAVQRVDGKLRFSPPKTGRSRRTIPLPAVCGAALRVPKAKQNGERLAAGPAWRDSGLVFTTTTGTPIEPRNLNRSFDGLCARAGARRVRPRSSAYLCLAAPNRATSFAQGVVMEVLDHSQIVVTMNVYSHMLPVVEREAADRMNATLSGPVAVTAARVRVSRQTVYETGASVPGRGAGRVGGSVPPAALVPPSGRPGDRGRGV